MATEKRGSTWVLKICLLGDGAVGKTSLRTRYLGEGFTTQYSETIGADFALKFAKMDDQTLIKFQIWDIAGQPRYTQVRSILFDRSDGGLMLFDLANRDSLKNVHNWVKTYLQFSGVGAVILIGNKNDLREEGIPNLITREEGEEMARKLSDEFHRPFPYLETSAKTGENVDAAFDILARTYLEFSNKSLSEK